MKIIVLGAGVIGTTTAWYLAERGHEVTVVDRREGAGLETSFANGGQVSACHAEPWAGPGAPFKIHKWLWRDDSPLLFRPQFDFNQWSWGTRFLRECTPGRMRENVRAIVAMSLYSRSALQELRRETGIQYDELAKGILYYFTDRGAFDEAVESEAVMKSYGLDRDAISVEEAVRIEPALAACAHRIVGATYTATDESGDAHVFTQRLADKARAERGVKVLYGHTIQGVRFEDGEVKGVVVRKEKDEEHSLTLTADAYVVALGSYSPLLTRPIGIDLPVYPTKGYSASVPIADASKAPMVSVTDDSAKIVVTRLGNRMRIAGTAELAGYNTELNPVRCQALIKRVSEFFPGAGHYERATFWTGLRPSTPSNVPLIGRTKVPNLWLNTGHGTLGWTMACGSGRALADLMSGRKPEVDFEFTK